MRYKRMDLVIICKFGWLLLILGSISAQEDSLRSALNAVDRRQKDLSGYDNYNEESDYGYSLENPDDLSFISSPVYTPERVSEKHSALERALSNYFGTDGPYLSPSHTERYKSNVDSRMSSPFREYLEENREKLLNEWKTTILNNIENDKDNSMSETYNELIGKLLEKYREYPAYYNRPDVYMSNDLAKRSYYYPRLGLDSIGLRKRNKNYKQELTDEIPISYSYDSQEDDSDKLNDKNNEILDYLFNKNGYYKRNRSYNLRQNYGFKRFPVSKRSSNNNNLYGYEYKGVTEKKDSVIKTDPKVVKELSNIFGTLSTEKPITTKLDKQKNVSHDKKTEIRESSIKNTNEETKNKKKSTSSQEIATDVSNEDDHLQIDKKSIKWSDYWGLDLERRKKSNDEINNEWLMERYHKAIAMSGGQNPSQYFKNHDTDKRETDKNLYEESNKTIKKQEKQLSDFESKLSGIEEAIIDDTIKFTGAHEGFTDPKEIQKVKDKVIARLSHAYNLEKMRHAIDEYKSKIADERARLKQMKNNQNSDGEFSEDKRASVPRKQAVDDDENGSVIKQDNNIKCAQGDENCGESSYRTPIELLKQEQFDQCPIVQTACNEVTTVLGNDGRIFELACKIHQLCLLCVDNNSGINPIRRCNSLFLNIALQQCGPNQECQNDAYRSITYLMEVNRHIREEPLIGCQLNCPARR